MVSLIGYHGYSLNFLSVSAYHKLMGDRIPYISYGILKKKKILAKRKLILANKNYTCKKKVILPLDLLKQNCEVYYSKDSGFRVWEWFC